MSEVQELTKEQIAKGQVQIDAWCDNRADFINKFHDDWVAKHDDIPDLEDLMKAMSKDAAEVISSGRHDELFSEIPEGKRAGIVAWADKGILSYLAKQSDCDYSEEE